MLLSLLLLTEISLLTTVRQIRNSEFAPKTSVLASGVRKTHLRFIG